MSMGKVSVVGSAEIAAEKTLTGGDLRGDVGFALLPDDRPREFVVRPRGSIYVFALRYVQPEQWGEPARVIGCPSAWTFKDGRPVFWPDPGTEYEVFELVPVGTDARPAD